MTEHAHSPSVAGGKILKSDRFDALRSFEGGVARAQTEAARLLTEAKAEGARLREAALNEGKAAAAALMVEHSRRIEADLKALDAALPALALETLRAVLNDIPEAEQVAAAAKRALADMDRSRPMALVVAPQLAGAVAEALERFGAADQVRIEPDPAQPQGSALLKTAYGDVELSVAEQLKVIAKAFRVGGAS